MDTDLVLTVGLVLLALSLPSLLSAWVEQRVPRVGSIMVVASIGMIVGALMYRPGGYAFSEVPGVVLGVLARFLR
jgi:formate-dependent nitrite reductase membrane component NrfD